MIGKDQDDFAAALMGGKDAAQTLIKGVIVFLRVDGDPDLSSFVTVA